MDQEPEEGLSPRANSPGLIKKRHQMEALCCRFYFLKLGFWGYRVSRRRQLPRDCVLM